MTIPLEIWDCPGNISFDSLDAPLSQFSSLIFVIDIQDLYQQPIEKLVDCVVAVYQQNPNMNLEVFVHKGDALAEDYKWENFRHIQSRVEDELSDFPIEYGQVGLNFYLTSIYDHSLREAFSRVLQRLVYFLPHYEDLINVFCANSSSTKTFLCDTTSRLYIATDSSPVDPQDFGLCADYLQMLNSFGTLYRSVSASPPRHRVVATLSNPSPSSPEATSLSGPLSVISSASHTPKIQSFPIPPTTSTSPSRVSSSASSIQHDQTVAKPHKLKNLFYPSASTSLSPSSNNARTLAYYLITPRLALLALLPTSVFEEKRGLVEYNVVFLREGVQEICEVEEEARKGG